MILLMDIEKRFDGASRSRTFQRIVRVFGLRSKTVLDLGCGFGEQLASFGPQSIGVTTNQDEVNEGRKRGLSIVFGNIEELEKISIGSDFDFVWANNFIEHILSPHAFLAKLRSMTNGNTTLLLGVPVIPHVSSLLHIYKFRGALASNHINFFTRRTLALTVERAGWDIVDIRPFVVSHAALDRLLGLISPHLYIVARKNESFRYGLKKVREWNGVVYYEHLLRDTGQL